MLHKNPAQQPQLVWLFDLYVGLQRLHQDYLILYYYSSNTSVLQVSYILISPAHIDWHLLLYLFYCASLQGKILARDSYQGIQEFQFIKTST